MQAKPHGIKSLPKDVTYAAKKTKNVIFTNKTLLSNNPTSVTVELKKKFLLIRIDQTLKDII